MTDPTDRREATDEDIAENAALVNRTWNEYFPESTPAVTFTREEAGRLTYCANACRGIDDPKEFRAMLDAERKRVDELQRHLESDLGEELSLATETIREDGRQSQRRREIFDTLLAVITGLYASTDPRTFSFSRVVKDAQNIHAAFTAALDAEKGGGE